MPPVIPLRIVVFLKPRISTPNCRPTRNFDCILINIAARSGSRINRRRGERWEGHRGEAGMSVIMRSRPVSSQGKVRARHPSRSDRLLTSVEGRQRGQIGIPTKKSLVSTPQREHWTILRSTRHNSLDVWSIMLTVGAAHTPNQSLRALCLHVPVSASLIGAAS